MYRLRGSHVIISKMYFLKIDFVLTNNIDPDEMLPYGAFHLGLHCLPFSCLGVFSLQTSKIRKHVTCSHKVLLEDWLLENVVLPSLDP